MSSTVPRDPAPPAVPVQATLDELGTPLSDVTFVVVDLETTGGSAQECGITEIGAVKVRGGEVVGEFQTLVDPGHPVPPFIAVLTGITSSMLVGAPQVETALPAFLEFARGSVLVAHNAGFDVGFLKAACVRTGVAWPGHHVLDTVRLAQHVVSRDEVPNRKLGTLARLFRSTTTPNHRALQDARATVDVLHGLLERVGNLGVTSLEELTTYTSRVTLAQRRKRHLAEGLPHAPGVYVFSDARGEVLYVGTSQDIRTRVRTYFTASETRSRMGQMVALAEHVRPVVCETSLEAQVRELRLIAEHKPRFNRRSRHPERAPWVKLTVEPFPRLSVVRQVRGDVEQGAAYLGPFGSTAAAERAVAALHEAFPLRQCTRRIPTRPAPDAGACVLADIGRCGAPCTGAQTREEYAEVVDAARSAFTQDAERVATTVLSRAEALSRDQRYEEAALHRDRLLAYLRGASRAQRLAPLAGTEELVAARRSPKGGWEVVLVRWGRLAGTTTTPPGADPMPFVEALRATGEVVARPPGPVGAAHPEETEKVLRWLESPGVRLVALEGSWSCPVNGASRWRTRVDPHGTLRDEAPRFGEPAVAPRHGRGTDPFRARTTLLRTRHQEDQ
ncbi:DEDD exonuclease domain-containing protein [Thalassiella azotivora]